MFSTLCIIISCFTALHNLPCDTKQYHYGYHKSISYVHVVRTNENGGYDLKVMGQIPSAHSQDAVFYHFHISLWTRNFYETDSNTKMAKDTLFSNLTMLMCTSDSLSAVMNDPTWTP